MGHRLFYVLGGIAALWLTAIIGSLLMTGLSHVNWTFLTAFPQESGAGGIMPELVNSLVMVGLAMLVSGPLALGAAIYRREYIQSPRWGRWWDRYRQVFLSVPSVVVGLFIYQVAIDWWRWPVSVMTGTLALIWINWPWAVTVADEAIRQVADSYRDASLALGANRVQMLRTVVLPVAMPNLIQAAGMAAARLLGESAALIMTAGVNVSPHFSLWGPGETLAVHLWYIRSEGLMPNRDALAAATGIVLLGLIGVLLWSSRRIARWFE